MCEQAMKKHTDALQKAQDLRHQMDTGIGVSKNDLEDSLYELFKSIEELSTHIKNGTAKETSTLKRDIAETWDYLRETHLPISLALLRIRLAGKSLKYGRENGDPQTNPSNRVLLLMSGYSVEQLVLCIALHYYEGRVRRVVPFGGTIEVEGNSWDGPVKREVLEGLRLVGINVATDHQDQECMYFDKVCPVEASNPAKVFQGIHSWARENANVECAIDVTGGQKPMDSGASYAAMYLGWPAWYLDFSKYHERLRRPLPYSLTYKSLVLPEAAFSHDSRKAIVELVETNQFAKASLLVEHLDTFVAESDFLEQSERDDIAKAKSLIVLSDAWLRADYEHPAMSACSSVVCTQFQSIVKSKTLRMTLENAFLSGGDSSAAALLAYAVEEYWRIKSVFDSSNDSRDCIVASHGLYEVLLDGMLNRPRFRSKITQVVVGVVYVGGSKSPLPLAPPAAGEQFLNQAMLFQRFPPAAHREKRQLLLNGTSAFDVRIPIPEDFDCSNQHDLQSHLNSWFESKDVPGKDRFVELNVAIDLEMSLSVKEGGKLLSNTQKEKRWGEYVWTDTRNLAAHWRTPLGPGFGDVATNAINEWLPHYIGLFALTEAQPELSSVDDAACKEEGMNCISDGRCRPWHNRLNDLRSWLGLPPA